MVRNLTVHEAMPGHVLQLAHARRFQAPTKVRAASCGPFVEAWAVYAEELMARRLMTQRGHQEDGEAIGKWRRALLTSTQLSTYYVGYVEVSDILRELRAADPARPEREVHDAVLAHGSPSPRHLRTLLGLAPPQKQKASQGAQDDQHLRPEPRTTGHAHPVVRGSGRRC